MSVGDAMLAQLHYRGILFERNDCSPSNVVKLSIKRRDPIVLCMNGSDALKSAYFFRRKLINRP